MNDETRALSELRDVDRPVLNRASGSAEILREAAGNPQQACATHGRHCDG
jgi:hypothetical protein